MHENCCAAEKYSFVDSEFLCPIRSMLNQPYSCLLLLLDQKRVIYSYSCHSPQKTYFYRMKNFFLRVSGSLPPRFFFWQFGKVNIVFFSMAINLRHSSIQHVSCSQSHVIGNIVSWKRWWFWLGCCVGVRWEGILQMMAMTGSGKT